MEKPLITDMENLCSFLQDVSHVGLELKQTFANLLVILQALILICLVNLYSNHRLAIDGEEIGSKLLTNYSDPVNVPD